METWKNGDAETWKNGNAKTRKRGNTETRKHGNAGGAADLDRVNRILRHPRFTGELERLAGIERDRVYCGHGMDHLVDVARIAYILSLESEGKHEKELIYAAALLHDIGRARQYEDETPHEKESARLAAVILPECGFNGAEEALIVEAILAHRTRKGSGRRDFNGLLYSADKLSRRCFECGAADDCDWEMKNTALVY